MIYLTSCYNQVVNNRRGLSREAGCWGYAFADGIMPRSLPLFFFWHHHINCSSLQLTFLGVFLTEQDLEYEQITGFGIWAEIRWNLCKESQWGWGTDTAPSPPLPTLPDLLFADFLSPILPMPLSLLAAGPDWHSHCHCHVLTEQLTCAARFKAPLEALVFP